MDRDAERAKAVTRRLPNCVSCGQPLAKSGGRMVNSFHAVRGVPTFGFCHACMIGGKAEKTGLFTYDQQRSMPLASLLARIAERGSDRLSLTHRPSLGRTVTLAEAMASAAEVEASPLRALA